jgi:DNA-binding LacI/PurR family transcriptional regulator
MREAGLRCPEDLAIAVFDDPQCAEVSRPALTAVSQPLYEMGQAAVDLLLKRIEDPRRRRTRVVLKTKFEIRESSRTPAVAGAD